jgi:hypothetical protein
VLQSTKLKERSRRSEERFDITREMQSLQSVQLALGHASVQYFLSVFPTPPPRMVFRAIVWWKCVVFFLLLILQGIKVKRLSWVSEETLNFGLLRVL